MTHLINTHVIERHHDEVSAMTHNFIKKCGKKPVVKNFLPVVSMTSSHENGVRILFERCSHTNKDHILWDAKKLSFNRENLCTLYYTRTLANGDDMALLQLL